MAKLFLRCSHKILNLLWGMNNNWNGLSEEVVSAGSVNAFKRRLDEFRKWKNDVLVDYVRQVQGWFRAPLVRPNQVINQVIICQAH